MKEMINLNFKWFMQTLLDRKDRMSMYNSLEVRVPFCDYRIAEYLYGVPWEMKDYQGREKGLLRHAMAGLLPQKVLYRKKSPYPKTFDPAYETMVSGRLRQLLGQMLYDDYDRLIQLCDCLAGIDGVVNMEERMMDVKRRYGEYPQEKWDNNLRLRRYFEEKAGKDIYEIVK